MTALLFRYCEQLRRHVGVVVVSKHRGVGSSVSEADPTQGSKKQHPGMVEKVTAAAERGSRAIDGYAGSLVDGYKALKLGDGLAKWSKSANKLTNSDDDGDKNKQMLSNVRDTFKAGMTRVSIFGSSSSSSHSSTTAEGTAVHVHTKNAEAKDSSEQQVADSSPNALEQLSQRFSFGKGISMGSMGMLGRKNKTNSNDSTNDEREREFAALAEHERRVEHATAAVDSTSGAESKSFSGSESEVNIADAENQNQQAANINGLREDILLDI